MKPVEYDDKPSDALLAEMAEAGKIKVEDGLEFDRLSLANQQLLERREFPATLFDEPVPWRFWKLCLSYVRNMRRAYATPRLQAARDVCIVYYKSLARNRVNGMTPFRSQLDFHDLLVLMSPDGDADGEVLRCHREAVYICFSNEYLNRRVG